MAMSYIFEDQKAMRLVCGANDSNLSYIEEYFKCSFSVRGNEIFYSADADTCSLIEQLFESLERVSVINETIGPSDILMEIKAISNKDSFGNSKNIITIGTKSVYPKGSKQQQYIDAMKNSQVVFAVGPAGTGKTFLAVSYCLGELLSGRKQKIIITRPVVEAGESLGFLPGDLSQKLNPYLKPLYDSMEATLSPSTVKRLEETNQIEIAPLAYMRGRSINNACVILDEAQNTTASQMKMFLTRLGENSLAIITGDITQIDLPKTQSSGLIDAEQRLEDVEGIAFVRFSARDTVRSRIVQRIINAYEKN